MSLFFASSSFASFNDVIPLANQIKLSSAEGFTVNEKTKICYPTGNDKLAKNADFIEYLFQLTGKKIAVSTQSSKNNAIILKIGKLKSKNQGSISDICKQKQHHYYRCI